MAIRQFMCIAALIASSHAFGQSLPSASVPVLKTGLGLDADSVKVSAFTDHSDFYTIYEIQLDFTAYGSSGCNSLAGMLRSGDYDFQLLEGEVAPMSICTAHIPEFKGSFATYLLLGKADELHQLPEITINGQKFELYFDWMNQLAIRPF